MSSSTPRGSQPGTPRSQPVLKPDYLGDRRLASVKVPELREFLTSKGLERSLVAAASTKFALVSLAEDKAVDLEELLSTVDELAVMARQARQQIRENGGKVAEIEVEIKKENGKTPPVPRRGSNSGAPSDRRKSSSLVAQAKSLVGAATSSSEKEKALSKPKKGGSPSARKLSMPSGSSLTEAPAAMLAPAMSSVSITPSAAPATSTNIVASPEAVREAWLSAREEVPDHLDEPITLTQALEETSPTRAPAPAAIDVTDPTIALAPVAAPSSSPPQTPPHQAQQMPPAAAPTPSPSVMSALEEWAAESPAAGEAPATAPLSPELPYTPRTAARLGLEIQVPLEAGAMLNLSLSPPNKSPTDWSPP